MSTEVPTEFNLDRVHEILAHEYRRSTLTCLHERTERLSLEELAEYIAKDIEPAGNARYDELNERIRIQLHHSHLPKLAAGGFVEYDSETSHMVELTSDGRELISRQPNW